MNKITITVIVIILSLCLCNSTLMSQSIRHSWWVIDNGGGKASGGSMMLSSSMGQPMTTAMNGGDFSLATGYQPAVLQLNGTVSTADIIVNEKWNMVSVPVKKEDMRKSTLYPQALTRAFYFSNGYTQKDTLVFGKGYWLKFPEIDTITLSGMGSFVETIDVAQDWNMIGTLTNDVSVTNIQTIGTTIGSSYFGFLSGSGYTPTTTLQPGKGYWIKVGSAGKLALRSGSVLEGSSSSSSSSAKVAKGSARRSLSATVQQPEMKSMSLRDARGRERELYFTESSGDIDMTQYELPPLPPTGIFDVRYTTQQSAAILDLRKQQEQMFSIALQGAEYPVTVMWDNSKNAVLQIDNTTKDMTGRGTTTITNPESIVRIKITSSTTMDIPKVFSLQQNYPNPFNPSTVIRYELPVDNYVTLKIYNALGQEVATLVDGMQDAGYKSVEWNANNVPSGMFFYRILAQSGDHNFNCVKKMLLLK